MRLSTALWLAEPGARREWELGGVESTAQVGRRLDSSDAATMMYKYLVVL